MVKTKWGSTTQNLHSLVAKVLRKQADTSLVSMQALLVVIKNTQKRVKWQQHFN